jgi:hypothetical protein
MIGFIKSPRRILQTLLCAATLLGASTAGATNYTLWVHGRNPSKSTTPGNYNDFSYWGPASTAAGVNKKAVNWDGYSSVGSQNLAIRNALDCFCTGDNWCTIAVHSAGDLQIGYALSLHGGSTRQKQNATPNASGVCGATDGKTQVGWNIRAIYAASGASGGSELADYGSWAISEPLTKDLVTTTSRAMYDHNATRGLTVYRFAGASGTLYSGILPGQDDEAVAYHSSGGVSGTSGAGFGNPSDWFSNDLTLGTAACEGGATKWTNNQVDFRDDKEQYNHYANGNWQGIISPTRTAVATYSY